MLPAHEHRGGIEVKRAFCMIRDLPHYRCHSFITGLHAAGYSVERSGAERALDGDVVVIWNRYGQYDSIASQAEKRGALVIVAENGFVGVDATGNQFYQLALHGHNGSGYWAVGEGDRLASQRINATPHWQASAPTGHIVVRGQRGIGRPEMASPPNWHENIAAQLRKVTKRMVRVIPHPGNGAVTDQRHVEYLAGAHALVVWSSSVGVKALVMGVPVIACSPYWVCGPTPSINLIESDFIRSDASNALRHEMLRRMAWAQWSLEEIASGAAFTHLLSSYANREQRNEKVCA